MNSIQSSVLDTAVSRNKYLLNATDRDYLRHERKLEFDWLYTNCGSADIPKASVLLGYTAKSDGIFFYSDDLEQLQFRPHTPWASEDGELPKYRTPKDEYDAFLAKHPEIETYWKDLDALKARCFTINGKPYLLITEGCIKAITGCMWDIPTVGLMGVDMGLTPKSKGKPDLVPVLKRLAEAGFGFIVAFDSDIKPESVAGVAAAEARLTKVLKSYGCDVLSVTGTWNHKDGKGMDDFINNEARGIEAFRAILMKAAPIGETLDTGDNKPRSKSRNKYLLDKIEAHWGERLRLNEMTQQIELNGRAGELNVERAYARLARELSLDIPKQTASDFVAEVAEKYSYSPVRDYLNSLTDIEPINLDTLAERYFGTTNTLHATLLKRTLIAAVARVFKPGCKVDTLCILQGDQGDLKSTFWETLASQPWFTDNLAEANEKDEKLKLRRYWILEFSEFETAYRRKEVEQLKAFLSSRIDSLRKPYGKAIEDFPRTSIFVGSTNRQEFLHDPTGERRYWVIPVSQQIPIKTVEAERDAIWAAAVAAYKGGEQWWLTPAEDKLLAEANQGWQSSDSWEEDILKYLELRSTCSITDILEKPLGLDIGKHGKGEQMRVSDILRRNGWVRTNKRVDGKVQRCWEKQVVTEVVTSLNPCQQTVSEKVLLEVVTEVVTPQNPCPVVTSDTVLPPVTTFSPNHSPNSDTAAGGDKTDSSQTEKSFENGGGNTLPAEPENLTSQGIEPVTTSPNKGGNTPQCPETAINKHQAGTLANQMRKAIANGDSIEAKEIWGKFENIPLSQRQQQRGLFWQNLKQTGEENKARLLVFTDLVEGEKLTYVGKEEQYKGLELTAYSADGTYAITITCLKPDGSRTTWIPAKHLKRHCNG
jgi:predicted P-loop ATPase